MVVSGVVALMTILWLGFLVHRSQEFAGSALGGVFGVSGAALMVVPLAYSLVKRIPALKRAATARFSMRTFLTWHIYSGLAGAILALVHTGHKFQSTLGIALTAMTLIVVISGYVGRYLLGFIAEDTREKESELATLRARYDRMSGPVAADALAIDVAVAVMPVVESMADLEYAIRAERRMRTFFSRWLKWHLGVSAVLYVLLGLHVWAAMEFGLRWFR